MSTIAIIAIVVGAIIIIALLFALVTRTTKRKRVERRQRQVEAGHAAERERAHADAQRAQAEAGRSVTADAYLEASRACADGRGAWPGGGTRTTAASTCSSPRPWLGPLRRSGRSGVPTARAP